MSNSINIFKPSVCFEIQKIIGISTNDGSGRTYKVQWAPSWISGVHLIGCEDMIEQFEEGHNEHNIKVEVVDVNKSDERAMEANTESSEDEVDVDETEETVQIEVEEKEETMQNNENDYYTKKQQYTSNGSFQQKSVTQLPNNGNGVNHPQPRMKNLIKSNNSVQEAPTQYKKQNEIDNEINNEIDKCIVSNQQVFIVVSNKEDVHSNHCADECTHFDENLVYSNKINTCCNSDEAIVTNGYSNIQLREETDNNKLNVHDVGNTHQCNICHRRFKNRLRLRRHELIHTDGKRKQFSCNLCSRMFMDQEKFLRHTEKHKMNDYRFTCSFCEKSCQTAADLRRHIRIHTAERPFQCSLCLAKFQRKYHLNRHLKTHVIEHVSPIISQITDLQTQQSKDDPRLT